MLEHGGNLRHAAQQYGIPLEAWLDLSTGINPNQYPVPDIPFSAWQWLPETDDGLIEAACEYYGCQSLLATAGTQAALQVLPRLRHACHIAMPKNMYQEHALAWQRNGHLVTLIESLQMDLPQTIDVLLLCNPNNPTGVRYSKEQLLTWHQQLASRSGWLIIDEAFIDATPEESLSSQTHLSGLFVLRSLGKFFALAGTRVGFLLGQKNTLSDAEEMLGPWPISGASRYIARHALQNHVWQSATRKRLQESSQQLQSMLQQYGLSPHGGTDLFQYLSHSQANAIHDALAKRGVWVRLFKDISALRFGLPVNNQWNKLEKVLQEISYRFT